MELGEDGEPVPAKKKKRQKKREEEEAAYKSAQFVSPLPLALVQTSYAFEVAELISVQIEPDRGL